MDEEKYKYIKEYVSVLISVSPEGDVKPLRLKTANGEVYTIDKVGIPKRRAATKVGGTGIRYPILINGCIGYLFEDEGKWFIETRSPF